MKEDVRQEYDLVSLESNFYHYDIYATYYPQIILFLSKLNPHLSINSGQTSTETELTELR